MKKISQILMIMLSLNAMTLAANPPQSTKANDASNTNGAIYTEDKQNILITADQPEFTIKLKSNPTTGYSWFLREYDNNVLVPVKHTFQGADVKLMGAPGFELWTFRVKPNGFVVPQQTTIRLVYARPWQGADNSSQIIFRVTTAKK